jgi:hypothetical protein
MTAAHLVTMIGMQLLGVLLVGMRIRISGMTGTRFN